MRWRALLCLGSALELSGAALPPAEEQTTFRFADPDLAIELVAAEPEVLSPVAMAFDAAGRLFVAEMSDYPLGPSRGQIRMLQDMDGDGRYEKANVFAENLPFPNGVLPWRDGLLVTSAPNILFLQDTNHDGRADRIETVLTGFAEGNQQLRVNGLLWGLDGWIYGANGRSDGSIHFPRSTNKFSLAGHDFRFRPDTRECEVLAGRSQFGLSRDDWGNRFLSWNTIPIRHEVIPERDLLRNPRIPVSESLKDLLPPEDDNAVFPSSIAPRTFNQESTSHFNALAGLMIYRGDALPERYYGNAFAGETLRNLVHRRVLVEQGPSFQAERREQRKEFLASSDPWFHPVNFATGPDGALYIADFYRQWVEHPGYVPEKLRNSENWRTGSEHGRIWRIVPRTGFQRTRGPDFAGLKPSDLARLLEAKNAWTRDTAARLLREKLDSLPVDTLARLAQAGQPVARVQVLHLLEFSGKLPTSTLTKALEDAHPRVRQVACALARQRRDFLPTITNLVHDSSAAVRLECALALARAEPNTALPLLANLTQRTDLDHWTAVAIRSSVGNRAAEFLQQFSATTDHDVILQLFRDLASDAAATGNQEAFWKSVTGLQATLPALAIAAGFGQAIRKTGEGRERWGRWGQSADGKRFLSAAVAEAEGVFKQGSSRLQRELAGGLLDLAGAQQFLSEAVQSGAQAASETVLAILPQSQETGLVPDLISRWDQLPVSFRRGFLSKVAPTKPGSVAIAAALEAKSISPNELDAAARAALLRTLPGPESARAQRFFQATNPDRDSVIAKFTPALELTGRSHVGAGLFAKACLQCHSMLGIGEKAGPDLSGIGSRSKAALLSDILDPSKQVPSDYALYTVTLRNGDVLQGLLGGETPASIQLRRPNVPEESISRENIRSIKAEPKSIMPEGLEVGLDPQGMADLLEFMASPNRQWLLDAR